MSSRKYMEKLLSKNNENMKRQDIGKLAMSPRIDAKELDKYIRTKPVELPSITASRLVESYFEYNDHPKLVKISKKLP